MGCLALVLLSALYYFRYQRRGRATPRALLAACRAALLCLLVLVLAEPVMTFKLVSTPKPHLWVLFDGTDSMAIQDELPESDRRKLSQAVGMKPDAAPPGASGAKLTPSRAEYVQSLLSRPKGNLLRSLEERFRIKAFIFDDGVRELADEASPNELSVSPPALAGRITTKGQFTALGEAFYELARRQATSRLAGLLVFSDFNQNSGPSAESAASRLGAPIYTVGVGPAAAMDLRVKLEAPLRMTKAERNEIHVILEQEGVQEPSVNLRVTAIRVDAGLTSVEPITIADRQVDLNGYATPLTIPYTPDVTGLYKLTAEVDALAGEVIDQNNRAEREVSIRDDFMRLMFVEYEPTWEWRFIKEVFHRDKLVGMRGFRTFLRSADPKVRQYNELFLRTSRRSAASSSPTT